mmetsp:Transcript_8832/g.29173  ORF Transcript_8832/g.29173 Transcript_8832/m.29173 type:complete len:226 (-) Transcript_8832:1101-1778(-)
MTEPQQPHRLEDLPQDPRHHRLTGARVAHEDHVERRVGRGLHPSLAALHVELYLRHQLLDVRLDSLETHHRVKLVQRHSHGLGAVHVHCRYLEVFLGQHRQRALRDGARLLDDDEDSVRLAGDCALDQVSRQPAVSLWDVDGLDEPRHERLEPRALERIDEGEALGMGHLGHNLGQLCRCVVGKGEDVGEARGEPGVCGEESGHLLGVTSQDDDHLPRAVFRLLD